MKVVLVLTFITERSCMAYDRASERTSLPPRKHTFLESAML
jgi:hypothetical protein